ncbi:MAG: retention module-containing protein, partial [Pseudomonas sp.]
MATLIGVVRQVVGEVYAVAGDGSRRPLVEGDRVFAGEQIVTGAEGAVAIALVGGGELTLGRDSNLMLDTQLLANTQGGGATEPTQGAEAAPSDQDLTDVEKLQAAIAAGADPTLAGEATAAGPGAGGAGGAGGNAGGGHSFVLLSETAGALDPVIGFPTAGFNTGPEFPNPEPIITAEPVLAADGIPSGGEASGAVDEDGLPGGIPGGVDDLPGSFTTVTGSLGYSFGPDGPGSFAWSTAGLPVVTSGGVPLTYSVSADGLTLTAIAGGVTVFTLTVTDLAAGTYEFNLLVPLDHPGTSVEDDLGFQFDYTVTDSNGTTASGSLTITVVDDDSPAVSANQAVQLDDDALSGGIPGGGGDDPDALNVSGTLSHSFGADGAGSVEWLTTGALAGFTYEKSGDDLLVKQGTTTVLTVTLNTATGAYSVTQNAAIAHPAGTDENNLDFTLNYRVTDRDGDSIDGNLLINVDDDTPVLASEQAPIAAQVDEDELPGGNPDGDATGTTAHGDA